MGSWEAHSPWFQKANKLGFAVHSATIAEVPEHGHSTLELAYVEQGHIEHHIDGKNLTLGPGDYYIVDYGVSHSYKKLGTEKVMVRNLLFLPKFLDRSLEGEHSFDAVMNSYLLRFCYRTLRASPTGITFHDEDGRIGVLVDSIIKEFKQQDYGYLELVRCAFVELLILTMRKIGKKEDAPEKSPEIQKMLSYIHVNYKTKPALSYFARELGYAIPYLSGKFSREVGMGFAEYIQYIRLEQACHLLETTNLPINRVANQVGYENIKHFNEIFKRKFNLTPREFRAIQR